MTKMWGGRFQESAAAWVDEFGASIDFDNELVEEDIQGSLAHVRMLKQSNILTATEAEQIESGLQTLLQKAQQNELHYSAQHEDIHMNLEKMLIDEIGPVGGKLHTGRSRNDQIATDIHLYVKKQVDEMLQGIASLQSVLVAKAKHHVDTIFPGYTHLQRAQPVSFAHHLLAYFWMLERDYERYNESLKRIDRSPLGAGALAGTTFPIDRDYAADLLGFADVYENSLDAVSDRDFIAEFLSHSSMLMMHLSRFCEELIQWSSEEFQFVEIDDTFATGSSMMPQKKNPDMAELIRGKTGRVYGNLSALLTVMKGLPLAYNKDLQEDKEGLFDTVQTVKGCVQIFSGMMETLNVNTTQMQSAASHDFSNATELADYLVEKGLPFREAHEVIGKLVLTAIQENKVLVDLPLDTFQKASKRFGEDIYDVLDSRNVVARRNSRGGTGFKQVQLQLHKAASLLNQKHNA